MTLTLPGLSPTLAQLAGYRCILADPPWDRQAGGGGRGAQEHYPLLSPAEIVRVMLQAPEWRPHPDGSVLWLWSPSVVEDALFVARSLGYRQVAWGYWEKRREDGGVQWGTGQYMRYCAELFFLCVRGRVARPATALLHRIEAQRTQHSRKPEEIYELVEATTPGPYVEFFARRRRAGWDAFGNDPALSEARA